jgi:hypothetical protein
MPKFLPRTASYEVPPVRNNVYNLDRIRYASLADILTTPLISWPLLLTDDERTVSSRLVYANIVIY